MQQLKDNHPNFRDFGYQVIEQLGINYTGGRFTYKAIELENKQLVVIKQFRFATPNSGWDGYKALEREIKTLQKINHPQIPKYITSFDSGDGLCLVMEYVEGQPLSSRTFEIEEVYNIAQSLLGILTYIHSVNIIHRDLKPENILIDKDKKIYLIDFGLASFTANNQSMAASSMVAGTIGLMPPEQLLNRRVTTKSDIYSLGVTVFCLLMKQKTNWISSIVDSSFRIRVREYLAEQVSEEFIGWLEKCVKSNLEYRFKDAKIALTTLKQIQIERDNSQIKLSSTREENSRLTQEPSFWSDVGGSFGLLLMLVISFGGLLLFFFWTLGYGFFMLMAELYVNSVPNELAIEQLSNYLSSNSIDIVNRIAIFMLGIPLVTILKD